MGFEVLDTDEGWVEHMSLALAYQIGVVPYSLPKYLSQTSKRLEIGSDWDAGGWIPLGELDTLILAAIGGVCAAAFACALVLAVRFRPDAVVRGHVSSTGGGRGTRVESVVAELLGEQVGGVRGRSNSHEDRKN